MAYDGKPPRTQRLTFERRVLGMALLAGLPAALVAMVLLWVGDYSAKVNWTLGILVVGWWLAVTFSLRERIIRPLQTLSNMLAALREGDYSIRARGAGQEDSLGLALFEINVLGETLRGNRLGAMEATALLRTVMAEIDVAVFTFDGDHRLVLANRFGERLLGQPAEQLLGRSAETLGLDSCLTGDVHRTVEMTFPGSAAVGAAGRWEMRRRSFRQQGMPHQLLVLADVSRALREEERQAWQRLVRVLSHEINNSLAPIWSIAGSLQSLLRRDPRPPDWDEDFMKGLSVITTRSESLNRFMSSYALLARLPKPRLQTMDVQEWVSRVAQLETRLSVAVVPGPAASIDADSDQLDQLLINLVRNAADASLETGGGVSVGWERFGSQLEVWVRDEGPGLSDTANLFVPFFTTKPNGSGIGLALSRQIAEAHGGSLTLQNRRDGPGCEARLRLTV
ncbi:MAG: PAS domain-containing sensor histidine kinase [Gemmatimonadaceae bacterium]